MDRILRLGAEGLSALGHSNTQPTDGPVPDTAEQVYISSLALLKMLKHGRAGVPMEVMGLMLGEFVDDYTVTVVDVFAMPQSGTGVSVEAVDPVFQAKMLDMLKQTGRPEMVVGWYHSHPGFGCWLSGVDMNTQQSFEALSDRAVAVVVDPIQSVKGKMLMDLNKNTWKEGLALADYNTHCTQNHKTLLSMLDLVKAYQKVMNKNELTEDERSFIEAKRKKALEYRNQIKVTVECILTLSEFCKEKHCKLHQATYGFVLCTFKIFKCELEGSTIKSKEENINTIRLCDFLPESFTQKLLPFQREGVRIAISRSGRVLLADDMGLGKTVQALALLGVYQDDWPALIVTPSSLRFAWRDQCLRWLENVICLSSSDILVVVTSKDLEISSHSIGHKLTIISYDLMARCIEKLQKYRFGAIVMKAKRLILLSGTPAVSRPAELYSQISGIAPNLFRGGFHDFGLRYCAAKECTWGWDYSGCSNLPELQLLLEDSIMIRRMKADVLNQLPPKRRELVILDPHLIKLGRLKRHTKNLLLGVNRHTAMLQYFHETAAVKVPAIEQYILDLIEVGQKFILFAHHIEVMDALSTILRTKSINFIRIDGRTNSEQRSVVCRKFQEDESCLVALLSITAAGTGLNLTAASLVVFAELFWNPGILIQAEDRAYRIGQEDSVLVRYLLAEGTADDYIWSLIEKKLAVLSEAGLNRESFATANTTRMQLNPEQQSILGYLQPLLEDSFDGATSYDVDSESSSMISDDNTSLSKSSSVSNQSQLSKVPAVLERTSREAIPTLDRHDVEAVHLCTQDENFLLEATLAAEVTWLTEGLLNDSAMEKF